MATANPAGVGLVPRIVAALVARGSTMLPPDLRGELATAALLGTAGEVILLRRSVKSREPSHPRNHRDQAADSDHRAPEAAHASYLFGQAAKEEQKDRQIERIEAARSWWRALRESTPHLEGCTCVEASTTEYYLRSKDPRVDPRSVSKDLWSVRRDKVKKALERSLAREHAPPRKDLSSSKRKPNSQSAWAAWVDSEHRRLILEVFCEESGLCLAAVLIQAEVPLEPWTDLCLDILTDAWGIADVIARDYKNRWDAYYYRVLLECVGSAKLEEQPKAAAVGNLYEHMEGGLFPLVREVARALQTPVAAVFIPDSDSISAIAQVGYLRGAKSSAFRFSSAYSGVTRTLCTDWRRGDSKDLIAVETGPGMIALYDRLHRTSSTYNPSDYIHDPDQRSEFYCSDQFLLPHLQQDHGEARGPKHGPWAFAKLFMDRGVRGDRTHSTNGLLKVQGRIPHELDAPRLSVPRFAQHEREFLKNATSTLEKVLQRFMRSDQQQLSEAALREACAGLESDISKALEADPGSAANPRTLTECCTRLRNWCGARFVFFVATGDGNSAECLGCSSKSTATSCTDLVTTIVPEILRCVNLMNPHEPTDRATITLDGEQEQVFLLRVKDVGFLALVGVRHELAPVDADDGSRELGRKGLTVLVDRALAQLGDPLANSVRCLQALLKRSAKGPHKKARHGDKRYWEMFKQIGECPQPACRRQLLGLVERLAVTKDTAGKDLTEARFVEETCAYTSHGKFSRNMKRWYKDELMAGKQSVFKFLRDRGDASQHSKFSASSWIAEWQDALEMLNKQHTSHAKS